MPSYPKTFYNLKKLFFSYTILEWSSFGGGGGATYTTDLGEDSKPGRAALFALLEKVDDKI